MISSQLRELDGTVSLKVHFTLKQFLLREAVAKSPWAVGWVHTLPRSPLVWRWVESVRAEPGGSASNTSPTIWDKPLNVGLNFFVYRIMAIALSISQGS